MRLILVSGSCYPQASEKNNFISRLAIRLQQKGHEVAIIVPSENLYLSTQKIKDVTVFGISALPVFTQVKTLQPIPFLMELQVRRLITSLKPDIIHIHDHFALSNAFVRLNKEFNLPIIGTSHFSLTKSFLFGKNNIWSGQMEQLRWKKFSKVFNKLAVVTAQTERQAAFIQSKLTTKVITIPCGIDLDENNPFKDNEGIRKKYKLPKRPTLLYDGTIEPIDNLEDIVNGVAIAMSNSDFSFVIIGDGILKPSIETLVKKLGIDDQVYFFEALSDVDITAFYRLGDCFITAKLSETNRFSIMKAMAHGLPIITIDDVLLNDLVHDGINGYMFSAGDIIAISNYIHVVLSVKYIYREMSRKSFEYIQLYDLDKIVQSFEEIYHKNLWLHSVLENV